MKTTAKVTAEGTVDSIGPFFWGTYSDGKIKFFTIGASLWRLQIIVQWMVNE